MLLLSPHRGPAEAPADIKDIFAEYSENATAEIAQSIIDGLKLLHIFHRRGLNLEAFFKYLLGYVNPKNRATPKEFSIHEHKFRKTP